MIRRSFGLICGILLAGLAQAEVTTWIPRGFTITDSVVIPVAPDTAFDIMTGDISGWWDHHFSEKPKSLFIEPRAGGGFYEFFDESRHGAKHGTVILCDRGKKLTCEGPLGLSGNAISFVFTWEYEAVPGGTKVKLTANGSGQIDEGMETAVAGVWHHFFYDGLKPYVESGKYKEKSSR